MNPADLTRALAHLQAQQEQWRKLAIALGKLRKPASESEAETFRRDARAASTYLLAQLSAALSESERNVLRALAAMRGPEAPFLVKVAPDEGVYCALVVERPSLERVTYCIGQGFGPDPELARLRAVAVALRVLAARANVGNALPSEVDRLFLRNEQVTT